MSRRNNRGPYQPKQEFAYVAKNSEEPQQQLQQQVQEEPKFKQSQQKREGQNRYQRNDKQYNNYKKERRDYNDDKRDHRDNRRGKPYNQSQTIDEDYRRDPEGESQEHFDINTVQQKELTEVLTRMFKKNQVECPICFVRIHKDAKIWSCKQCYSPFHLGCVHKWIFNSNKENQKTFSWSCPKCNLLHTEELPQYYCFCGQEKNPEYNHYLVPHSCGGRCEKARGKYCPHPCPADCHPGPCPECNVRGITITCYCKKNKKQISCSEDQKSFCCQQTCERTLNCGNHQCTKVCHPGECGQCPITVEVSCFCGHETKEVPCGTKAFSCNRPCGKTLDCGNHQCQSKTCHAQCAPCDRKPELIKTCPCGKFNIDMLLAQKRTSCLDPIPSCGTPKDVNLRCGHKIRLMCGQAIPKCTQKVMQSCRCQSNQQMAQCWELDEQQYFVCDKVCKKKKSCQIHTCGKECCPANKGEDPTGLHLCLKVCDKPLNCGNHNCGLFCHIGMCQPCPIMILQPLTCYCGRTVKNPPNKCGTKRPECHQPCHKQLPNCEHLCSSECHPGECPPCSIVVEKQCRCGREVLATQCSKPTAVCTNRCAKTLECGHKCMDICPDPNQPCSNNCTQKCMRKLFCGHPCTLPCHKVCPKEPCKTQIRIKCPCGNREAFVDCGVVDEPLEKTLVCDAKCGNIKRFGAFYNTSMVDVKKTYYPSILLKFTNYNLDYLQKLERRIEDFLINTTNESYDFSFGKTDWVDLKKNALQILLSKHYKFDVQFQRMQNGGYSFTITRAEDTQLPKLKLSEYFLKLQKGQIQRNDSPFEAKLKCHPALSQHDIETIEMQIKDYKHDYYMEKLPGGWVINFWEQKKAEEVLKRIKKLVGLSQVSWVLELNNQVLDEQSKIQISSPNEVIVKKKVIQQQQQYEDADLSVQYTQEQLKSLKELDQKYKDVAQCTQMCDEEEIKSRTDLAIFEQDPFYVHEEKPKPEWMVRKYQRIQQGGQMSKEQLRTPSTLIRTIDFLLQNILDADSNNHFKIQPTYREIYDYILDRTQQVRQEANIIGLEAAYYLPKLLRFHIISFVEDIDQKENYHHFINILSQLNDNKEAMKYALIPAAFSNQLQQYLQHGDETLLQVCTSVQAGDFQPFFTHFTTTQDHSLKCVMYHFLPQARFRQTQRLRDVAINQNDDQGMWATDLADYVELHRFDSVEQALDFLSALGVDVSKTRQEMLEQAKPMIYWQKQSLTESPPSLPSKHLNTDKSRRDLILF